MSLLRVSYSLCSLNILTISSLHIYRASSSGAMPACWDSLELLEIEETFQLSQKPHGQNWTYLLRVIKQVWVQFSHSVVSNSLQLHGLQHARLPCSSPTPGACSNSCPSSWWCHPTISFYVVPSPASNLSQHQGIFKWVSSLHQVRVCIRVGCCPKHKEND